MIENVTENLSKEVPVGRVDGVGIVVVNILLLVVVLIGATEAVVPVVDATRADMDVDVGAEDVPLNDEV